MSAEDHLEKNTARLVQASFGRQARPDSAARAETLKLLVGELSEQAGAGEFPGVVLVLLGGMLVLTAIWLAGQILSVGKIATASLPVAVIAFWLALNLALLPVASVIIVLKRNLNG